MQYYELDELTKKYRVEDGQSDCHPETCSCWDFKVYRAKGSKKYELIFTSDSSSEVLLFLELNDKHFTGERL